ncbi:hypothetical protein BHM03_00056670 [Ensete ventricosum]|nr:hypothetical protein BHM03_00056670 [Ensete ventricosum]
MEKKHGVLSARGRSRSERPRRMAELLLLPRRWKRLGRAADPVAPRSGSLAPLIEGPDPGEEERDAARKDRGWGQWVRGQLSRAPSISAATAAFRRTDLRLLLGVMAAPLAPVHVCSTEPLPHLSIKDTPIQFIAASGGLKLLSSIRNAYANGKVKMVATEFETATRVIKYRNATRDAEAGGFVLWQMAPDMWYIELAVGGSKVHAGCNGELIWRHAPWLGAHAAKGPVRPLRRALQGLDPLTTASIFTNARCIGEKKVNGEDCFILKLCADPQTLKANSEAPAEVIRHVLFGYFSQRSGLLVHLEDSHLTRIQSGAGGDAVYWETSIDSSIDEYRPVEGTMIAHSGHSVVTLFRFGEAALSHKKTRMEEAWTIEEVAFNVPGLSMDCFIPPSDLERGSVSEAFELPQGVAGSHHAKVAAVDKPHDDDADGDIMWRWKSDANTV